LTRLPGYRFDRERFWIDARPGRMALKAEPLKAEPPEAAPEAAPQVEAEVRSVLAEQLGLAGEQIDRNVSFLDLGADSLVLMQISKALERRLGVTIPFRMLISKTRNLTLLMRRVLELRPAPEAPVNQPQLSRPPVTQPAAASDGTAGTLHRVLESQIELMRRQLELIRDQVRQDDSTT
jgi:acyl carrier protein